MGLAYWWILILWVIATGVASTLFYLQKIKIKQTASTPLAHTKRLRALPEYQKLFKQYRFFVIAVTILALALSASLALLASRPISTDTVQNETKTRDIMLCLDASGSMIETDIAALETFKDIIKGFGNERVGLSLFDAGSLMVFPLTNDYDSVNEYLDDVIKDVDKYAFATYLEEKQGSSLVGDGLLSCTLRFDKLDEDRSRSIILVTDNYSGKGEVTIQESSALAKEKKIKIFTLEPNGQAEIGAPSSYIDSATQELVDAANLTGGQHYNLEDSSTVRGVIADINEQEKTAYKGPVTKVTHDQPRIAFIFCVLILSGYVYVMWRLNE